MTNRKFREIILSQMVLYNPLQKRYPVDHKMREVTKVVKKQMSVTVGSVMEKDFAVAKKKKRICKDITTLCVHAEK